MTAFAVAVGALFADRNLATDALWRQGGGGTPRALRVIRRNPDSVVSFGEGRFVADTDEVLVQVASAPDLGPGDTLEIGAEMLVITGDPVRDARRLVWTAQVRAL